MLFCVFLLIILISLGSSFFQQRSHTATIDEQAFQYQGDIKNHKFNGKGTLKFDNGDTYTGDFSDGLMDGEGKFVSHEGWNYTGSFTKGKINGQGTFKTDGATYKGKFENGVYKGK